MNKTIFKILFVVLFISKSYCVKSCTFYVSKSNCDTIVKYICDCGGNRKDTTNIVLIPFKIEGRNFNKLSFAYGSFIEPRYDYLTIQNDTIFIVDGKVDPNIKEFDKKKEILCVLSNRPRMYKRVKPIENRFFPCFYFKKKYFDLNVKEWVYCYDLDVCGTSYTSDLPFLKTICFTKTGRIASFVYDIVSTVCKCKMGN
jgi:hypothetical protein